MGVRSLQKRGGGGGRILLIGDLNYNNIYFECYFPFCSYDAIQVSIGAKK